MLAAAYYDRHVMVTARNGHHKIIEQLVAARADLNTKSSYGCAHSPRPVRRRRWSLTLPIAPAPSDRSTALHIAAVNGYTKSTVPLLVPLLVGGADQTVTNNNG
jgi:hypothetical protein